VDEGLHLIGIEGPRAFRAESKAVVTVSSVPFKLGRTYVLLRWASSFATR